MSASMSWPDPIDALEALRTATGAGVRVAVLDSGIEWSHPDLLPLRRGDDLQVVPGDRGAETRPGDGEDPYGHGTAIAGLLLRHAPEIELGSIRVLNPQLRSRVSLICEGARRALDLGYHILHCSFGCRGDFAYLPFFKDWIDRAYIAGSHVVAAASNLDPSAAEWPGHFPTILCTTPGPPRSGEVPASRRGSLVEFLAPGESIDVPWCGGSRKQVTGSSFAAPVVTAALARLLSAFPGLDPLGAKSLMLQIGGKR